MKSQRQFGITTLLFVTAICAVASLWVAGWLRRREAMQQIWKPWNKSSVRVTVETNVPQHTFSDDGAGVNARNPSNSNDGQSIHQPVPIEVESLRNVQLLRFDKAHFDEESIDRLSSVGQLSDLRIKNSLIPQDTIRRLKDLPLVRLDLVNCGLTDRMLTGCEELTRLQILYLVDNDLSDDCIKQLIQLKQLKKLDLRDNSISSSALINLKSSLPGCTIESGQSKSRNDDNSSQTKTR
ncbi:MAG: hypothetical protein GY768_22885 [Planctomycetaceae bacterium]|nr:hypothetical protein [Planctomycetaceae bacterium]